MSQKTIINILGSVPEDGTVTKSLRNYNYELTLNEEVTLNYSGKEIKAIVESIEGSNGYPYSIFKTLV